MPLISHWNQVYTYLRRRGAQHHDAQDWTQAVFATLAANGVLAGQADEWFESPKLQRNYLYTMARNEVIDSHRQATAKKRRSISIVEDTGTTVDTPLEALFKLEALESWERQLDRLEKEITDAHKKALYSKVRSYLLPGDRFEGLEELANETGFSVSATKVQIHRWRKCLLTRLQETLDEPVAA